MFWEKESSWFWKRYFYLGVEKGRTSCRHRRIPLCILGAVPRNHTLDCLGVAADFDNGVQVAGQERANLELCTPHSQRSGLTLHLDEPSGDVHGRSCGGWLGRCHLRCQHEGAKQLASMLPICWPKHHATPGALWPWTSDLGIRLDDRWGDRRRSQRK